MDAKKVLEVKTNHDEIFRIACKKCKRDFGVERYFEGIITCPYCGEYVEG